MGIFGVCDMTMLYVRTEHSVRPPGHARGSGDLDPRQGRVGDREWLSGYSEEQAGRGGCDRGPLVHLHRVIQRIERGAAQCSCASFVILP